MFRSTLATLFLTSRFLGASADYPAFHNSSEYLDGKYGYYPTQRYITEPDLRTPVGNILIDQQPGAAPETSFMWSPGGPARFVPITGPMMLDANTLDTIWQGPVFAEQTIGAVVQTCNNSQYMTFWAGKGWANGKGGRAYIFNNQYELAYNISAMNNLRYADCHEVFLTPRCTAIITIYDPRPYDLSDFNITDGWLLDSYFQEIDLATGELLFQWRASDFVKVTDAVWFPSVKKSGHHEMHAYDYFHINSVEKDDRGNYLVSARHTNAIYYISGINGGVIWTLGGPRNDFRDLSNGTAVDFTWQHHARWVDANCTRISLFDDRNSAFHHSERPISRGMIVELDYTLKTATLVHEWDALHNITSAREGSMQVLPNGNAILGYGQEPGMTEYAPDGRVLWDVTFGPIGENRRTADNYRIEKTNWTGAPTWAPKIAAGPAPTYDFNNKTATFVIRDRIENGTVLRKDTAYFSWNGATEMKSWAILASNDTSELSVTDHWLMNVERAGFETHLHIGGSARYIRALALDAEMFVLHVTAVLDMQDGSVIDQEFDPAEFSTQLKTVTTPGVAKQTWSQVKQASTPRNLGVLGALCALGTVLGVALVLMRYRKRRGYEQTPAVDEDLDKIHHKYMDIDLRSLSSSNGSISDDGESSSSKAQSA